MPFDVARIDEYEPPEPVDLTICLRAFYYPDDRQAFFRRIAGYTRAKFVFDFDPRVYDRVPSSSEIYARVVSRRSSYGRSSFPSASLCLRLSVRR